VYCVLGNHDAWSDPDFIVGALREAGLSVLVNQSAAIEQGEKRFWLLGTGCYSHGDTKLWECVRGVPREEPRILLVHEPDFADSIENYVIDLQLSGHSHGGQIRFPGVGALYLPPLARKYPMGFYKLATHPLYTNVGVGSIGVHPKLRTLRCVPSRLEPTHFLGLNCSGQILTSPESVARCEVGEKGTRSTLNRSESCDKRLSILGNPP
jgi:predicted MPP superfamily phosphohydrolase